MKSDEKEDQGTNELLWEKYDEISNVINTTNDTIFGLSNRLLETENRISSSQNENILIEKKFDQKLSLFMETTIKDCPIRKIKHLQRFIYAVCIESDRTVN